MSSNKLYSGAGVIIIDFNKNHVIMFKDHTNTYNDAGGMNNRREKTRNVNIISQTASRELLEESRGTIYIPPQDLLKYKHVDIESGKYLYRCYIVYQSCVSCTRFYQTDVSKLPYEYQECTRMTRFPISQFNKGIGNTIISDNREKLPLGNRGKKILRNIFF